MSDYLNAVAAVRELAGAHPDLPIRGTMLHQQGPVLVWLGDENRSAVREWAARLGGRASYTGSSQGQLTHPYQQAMWRMFYVDMCFAGVAMRLFSIETQGGRGDVALGLAATVPVQAAVAS